MTDIRTNPHIAPAVQDANALVTACLGSNFNGMAALLPDEADGAWLAITLTRLSVELINSLAEATDQDPMVLWQKLALDHLYRLS